MQALNPTLQFLGAAGTVTGSKFLLSFGKRRVLLDAGLFQGQKHLRLRNWSDPPFDPARLDAVVLSHAHIDHSGWLPLLARRGFRGAVHCTSGTRDLLGILLPDAAKLQKEEADYANRKKYSKHHPALPLFDEDDVRRALELVVAQRYGEPFDVAPGLSAFFRRTGHILGSASIELTLREPALKLLYSGDVGRWDQPILCDPELAVAPVDHLLIESTYGDRRHAANPERELERIVNEAAARRGALLIPAFAVGRTQMLIWILRDLEEQGRIPKLPVFLDSPMANRVSEVYCRHGEDHDDEMKAAMDASRCPLCCKTYTLVATAEESKALNRHEGPMIVIAGSGMATGGRILHHLKQRLPDERTTVLLVGWQAAGTRGRALRENATRVKMLGELVPVRAHVETIDGLSAHADQDELRRWLSGGLAPRRTWVVHGEPQPAETLAAMLRQDLGWDAAVAQDGERVELLP